MSFWETIGVGLLLAIAAFVFNLVQWLITEKNKSRKAYGNILIVIIDQLKDASIEYWLSEHTEFEENLRKIELELLIVSLTRILPKVTLNFTNKVNAVDAFKLNTFSSQIFDIATGDDFSSENKKANRPKSATILRTCGDIKVHIMGLIN